MKTEAYYKGYEAKLSEIKEMGHEAANNKFNLDYPPGQKYNGSPQGFDYMQGEFSALFNYFKRNL